MLGSRLEGHNPQDAEATPEAGRGCRFKTRARVRLRAQLSPRATVGQHCRRSARAVPAAEAGNAPRRAEQAGGAQRDAGQGKKSGTSFCSNP